MNAESLVASASINIGLALVLLFLFSVIKKQSFSACIYYPRRLSQHRHVFFEGAFVIHRFLPSASWISHALRVSEDELIQNSGLDALIVIRLFKFGIKFFVVCSLVGVAILLPVNFTARGGPYWSSFSTDSFTISNIRKGSDRLWVHFSCLCFVSVYGLHLLYKEYNEILVKRIEQLRNIRQQRPDQLTILVREIPFCMEHRSHACSIDHFFSKHHTHSYQSYQILIDGKYIEDLLSQATSIARNIEKMRDRLLLKKHRSLLSFLHCSQDGTAEIALQEERLRVLSRKICHAQNGIILKEKELPVAFVTFKSRLGAALAVQSQQHTNPLLWITETAPEPRDIIWRNLALPFKCLPFYRTGVYFAASLLTIFFAIPVTAVQGIAKFEKLKRWFPPAMAVQLIPGLRSIVTGYLPGAILSGFMYIVPFAMLGMVRLSGYISRSKEQIRTCNMVFYFLVGNVFFLSVLSGSLLDDIGESFTHPRSFPSHLARAVPAQADFFVTYILTDGLSGFSLEILQPGLFLWDFFKSHTYGWGEKRSPYLYSLPYYRVIPLVSLTILIGMIYAVVAPLLLPFLIGYFSLGYIVYMNQIQEVYVTVYETSGQYWPYIHHFIFISIILMQITMIGLFGLKSKPAASVSTIPLVFLTFMFNEYCKIRFLPTFHHYTVQNAVENDDLDEKSGIVEADRENVINAYRPPFLQPVSFTVEESSSIQPLLSAA